MGSEDRWGEGDRELRVSLGRLDGWTVASLAGPIDILTAPRLRVHLEYLVADHGGRPRVIVDLGGVTFCDARGLSAFITAHHTAARRGGTVRLVAPPGRVRRVLSIAHPTHDLQVHDTVSEAMGGAPGGR